MPPLAPSRDAGAKAGRVELAISGMTCASCAARIEKRLNKLEGVSATVNFASEQAAVSFDPAVVSPDDLISAVEGLGYGAALPQEAPQDQDPTREYQLRLVLAAGLSVPVAVLTWVGAAQFSGWKWVALVLATAVVGYSGWPFHRAAVLNARHWVATMDTLVSLGTLAAWAWSVVVLASGLHQGVYFDSATLITTLILLGRFLEARAKRRSGAAIRALSELEAKDARVLRGEEEVLVPVGQLRVGDRFVVRPGEKVATDGVVEAGVSAVDQSILTGEAVPVEVGPGSEVAGGTLNSSGQLVVRATKVGAETALAQVRRLVAQAQAGKAQVQRLAHAVAFGRRSRLYGGRGGDGDRLSLRPRVGHPHRPHGGHRPGCTARDTDQGPRGAGTDPEGDNGGAGQDWHRHRGQDAGGGPRAGRGGGRSGPAPPGCWRRGPQRAPGGPGHRRPRPPAAGVPPGGRELPEPGRRWCRGSGGRPCCCGGPVVLARRLGRGATRGAGGHSCPLGGKGHHSRGRGLRR